MGLTAEQIKLADELAEVSLSKSSIDKSAFSFTELSPEMQKAIVGGLLGAGVGGVSGMLTDKPKRYALRNALLGGLLGGGAGYFLPKAVEGTPKLIEKAKEQSKPTPEDVSWNRRLGGAVAGGALGGGYAGAREVAGMQRRLFENPAVTNIDTEPVKQLQPIADQYMPSAAHYRGMAAAVRGRINPKTMNEFEISKHELMANALDALAKKPPPSTGLASSIQGELSGLRTPVSGSVMRDTRSLNPFRLLTRKYISIPNAEKRLLDVAKNTVISNAANTAESLRRNAVSAVSGAKVMQPPLRHSRVTAQDLGTHVAENFPEILSTYGPQKTRGSGGILRDASESAQNLYKPEAESFGGRVGSRALAGAGAGFALAPSLFSLLGWDQPAAPEATVP